jgi:hypothetical protein
VNSNMDSPAPIVKPKRPSKGQRPVIEPGQMYTTGQATIRANVSKNTLKGWVKNGLPAYHPDGTRNDYYFAEDIQEYVRKFRVNPPAATTPAKSRKRKEG